MSSDATPRLALPVLPPTPLQPHVTHNEALAQLDALTDLYLKGQFVNTPPGSPADGDSYLLGAAPTGGWSGHAYKIAYCLDGAWRFFTPFDGLRAFVAGTNAWLVYVGGQWIDGNALIGAGEVSIASAATCNLGAAGSLFVAITGTTAITGFGTSTNLLRFVRFAGSLTLTHNATSLVLPGAANITSAAGDSAIFTSDGSGNWRCRSYSRASGVPLNVSAVTGSGAMVLSAAPAHTGAASFTNANNPGIMLRSGASGSYTYLDLGRTAVEGSFGVAGAGGNFFPGTAAGDIAFTATNALWLGTAGTAAIRIGTDQSVLLGATANGGWTGGARLEARQAGSNSIISAYGTGPGTAYLGRIDNVGGALAAWYYQTSAVGSITTNGTSTAYNTTSDARRKDWQIPQRDHRDAIAALWVGDFIWKDSGQPGFGVLAQQAWEVMPAHAGVTRPATEDGVWSASAEPFAHLALWGVKDLYGLVAALAARVAELEARHAAG